MIFARRLSCGADSKEWAIHASSLLPPLRPVQVDGQFPARIRRAHGIHTLIATDAKLSPLQDAVDYENLSPLRLLNGAALSYLLFSTIRWSSLSGACLVGAGSVFDSWLGEPTVSVRGGALLGSLLLESPMAEDEPGWDGTLPPCSSDSM